MPDIDQFFSIISNLIRPGGALFIYEGHPILGMFKPGGQDDPVEWELSYFDKAPYVDTDRLDYFGGENYDALPVTSFIHPMSNVIMAAIKANLRIEHFEEHPHHISNTWWNVERANLGLPMSYTLVLRKSAA